MAAKIPAAIPSQAFEQIRDRIALILAEELPSQATLTALTYIGATVWTERFVPFGDEEFPAVNVSCATGDYDLMTSIHQDGTYIYHIDVFMKAKTSTGNQGDKKSMLQLQRLCGVIRAIIMDTRYVTLDFARPFIEHREVSDIKFATPQNAQDASSSAMGRLTVSVRVPENVPPVPANLIDGYETTVKMNETDLGYFWESV